MYNQFKIISVQPFILPPPVNDSGELKGSSYRKLPFKSVVEHKWGHNQRYGMGWLKTTTPTDSLDDFTVKATAELNEFIKNHPNQRVVVIIGGDFDQWGPQANYGRGINDPTPETFTFLIDDTLEQLAGIQTDSSTPIFYLGTPTDRDIDSNTSFSNRSKEYGKRIELLTAITQSHEEASKHVIPILLNGGHNLNKDFQKGIWNVSLKDSGTQIYEIQLDRHADCRLEEPEGGHSGSHNFELREEGVQGGASFLGIHYGENNTHNREWIKTHDVDVHKIDDIRNSYRFIQAVEQVVEKAKESKLPVVLTICGDTINGFPSSAGSNVKGVSPEDTLQLIRECSKRLGSQLIGINILEGNKLLAEKDTQEGVINWQMNPRDMAQFLSQAVYTISRT